MNRALFAVALAGMLANVVGCENDKVPEPTSTPPPAAANPTPPAPVTAATPAASAAPVAVNIPVAADFEEEAEKTITKANYRTELDSLEAEIK